ncbi:MAG: HEAT repeat domain-containing protein [Candidatus Omnitrophica bacterium]|jgi:hypothetical protein|nr:HEAT repeat domain-containing protein [Candidatus Omnitrophota bacterium]
MDGHKNTFADESHSADEKIAAQLAGHLFAMIKAAHLYPKGHQMLLQVIEKFLNYLNYVLGEKQIATFKIFNDDLFVLDEPLDPQKIVGIGDFVEELQKRYIRQIIFNPGATLSDLNIFIELLRTPPESIEPLGGSSKIVEHAGAQGIRIIEYYFRRHGSLDQERLLNLTHSEIFRFFTDDTLTELDIEQTRILYELLKESSLICALLKIAAQYLMRNNTVIAESEIIVTILKKIRQAVTAKNFSEESEIKTILTDIVASFDKQDLFNLVFEQPNDEILEYTDAAALLSGQLDSTKTAELLAEKFANAPKHTSIIEHTKNILNRLFIDRKAFLTFLPIFKEKLQNAIPYADKTKKILNDICNAFAPGFSLDEDIDLSLGTISEGEKSDIVAGLAMLKAVHIEKTALETAIGKYDEAGAYTATLQKLLEVETDLLAFQQILKKLVLANQALLNKDNFDAGIAIFLFFHQQISGESNIKQEYRQIIIEACADTSPLLLEKLFAHILFNVDADRCARLFEQLFDLLGQQCPALLLKSFAREEHLPKKNFVSGFLSTHYTPDILSFSPDLSTEPAENLMRIIDLFRGIDNDDVLAVFWKITFHDNARLSHRALALIAERPTSMALKILLQAIKHPNLPLRIAAIEYLAQYPYKITQETLVPIARGQSDGANNDIRIAAIKSLAKLNSTAAKTVLQEILKKKRFLFFPIEPKPLRIAAKEQLRLLTQG